MSIDPFLTMQSKPSCVQLLNQKPQWDDSYQKFDNYVFYPHEEVIRFVSKNIRKKVGHAEFKNHLKTMSPLPKILDLGCGIGRHIVYCHEMGLDSFGADLYDVAINYAKNWASKVGILEPDQKIKTSDIRNLPWNDSFFDFAISHGVLDSMHFEIARKAVAELFRVLKTEGLFYCDLVSGDDSHHSREFSGEKTVQDAHEKGTIQSYFNYEKILRLFAGYFQIQDCQLIRREDVLSGYFTSRYHLTLKKTTQRTE